MFFANFINSSYFFFVGSSVIYNDNSQIVVIDDELFISPDVQILDSYTPSVAEFPRSIAMELGGLSLATTAVTSASFGKQVAFSVSSLCPLPLPNHFILARPSFWGSSHREAAAPGTPYRIQSGVYKALQFVNAGVHPARTEVRHGLM